MSYPRCIFWFAVFSAIWLGRGTLGAQEQRAPAAGPLVLPGRGLAEHDFLYAGEGRDRRMFIVREGAVVWSYDDPSEKGEISDAVRLSNGNILWAHQFAIELISPAKKVLWKTEAPEGCEIHTGQPIGLKRVIFIQNGPAPKLVLVNIETGKTEREWPLKVGNPQRTHGQFRRARLTEAGTLLVAHMDADKVSEYDETGKEIWSIAVANPWSASRMANGNTLITSSKGFIREVDAAGRVMWEWKPADAPEYQFAGLQTATRLANGNTLINNWANPGKGPRDGQGAPVQAVEVNPAKQIVWALRAWSAPADLGPSTTIQLLDEKTVPENVHFGKIH